MKTVVFWLVQCFLFISVSVSRWLWQQLLFSTLGGCVGRIQRSLLSIRMCYFQQISDSVWHFQVCGGKNTASHCVCNQAVTADVISLSMRSLTSITTTPFLYFALGLFWCQAEKVTGSVTDRSHSHYAIPQYHLSSEWYLIFPSEWNMQLVFPWCLDIRINGGC